MPPVLDRRTAAILASVLLTAPVQARKADTAPPAPSALITIPEPLEASRVQLHGYAGAGTALIRIDDECATLPVRFVASDYGGDDIIIGLTGPIRLRVLDPGMVRALHQGRDLVTEDHAPALAQATTRPPSS